MISIEETLISYRQLVACRYSSLPGEWALGRVTSRPRKKEGVVMGRVEGSGIGHRAAAIAGRRHVSSAATALTGLYWLAAAPAAAQAGDRVGYESDMGTDIVVTAQRREERLEDVPISIAAISSETMNSAGVNSVRDLSKVVTGLQIGQGGAFPAPALRGITTLTNGTSTENNVAVYVDGIYQPAAQAINIDLPNIADIQVLKGPQGALYGRNATGGAILINTITARDRWEGRMELTYARFNDMRASGYVAGPLSDKVGISIAGYTRKSDGYHRLIDRTVPNRLAGDASPLEQDSLRTKLILDLSEAFSATLGYNYTHISDARGNMYSVLENVPGQPAGSPPRPTKLGTAAWNYKPLIESRQHDAFLKLELDTALGTLRSNSSFSHFVPQTDFDFDGTYRDTAFSSSRYIQKTWQETLEWQVDAVDALDLIVGGMYYKSDLQADLPGANTSFGPNLVVTQRSIPEQHVEAWALYADATWNIADRLYLNLGGRYAHERQASVAETLRFPAGEGSVPTVSFPRTRKTVSFSRFTPRGSVRFELAERTNVYASYSRGFRSGYFASSTPPTPAQWQPVKPEDVDAFEVGVKTAGRGYRFEFSAFHYDYRNLHVGITTRDPTCGSDPACARILALFGNAPKSKVRGIEASFDVQPIDNLSVRGGATWLHARYGAFPNATGVGVNPAFVGTTTFSDPLKNALNVGQVQDWSGLQMARAPDFTANLGIDYTIPNRDGGLRMSVHVTYTDSYVVSNPSVWGNAAGVPLERQRQQRFREGGFALLSAQITWTEPSGHVYTQVFGNNLTDHRYRMHYTGTATTITGTVAGTNGGTYSPMAEPRTYGVRLGYRF
jgi:iron complex outermembrane receptor protein